MSEIQDRIEACARMLMAAARESGVFVTGDGRVSETDAAGLVGMAPGTIRNKRSKGEMPRAYKMGIAGSQMSYRLVDLAAWIEASREDF